MIVAKSKSETADYDVLFAEEDIELLQTIATENIMLAQAFYDEPNMTDTYLLDHGSKVIPFPRSTIQSFVEKLVDYAGRTEERAAAAAASAPEGYGDEFWFHRTLLGQAATALAATFEEHFTKVREAEIDTEVRTIMKKTINADAWLRRVTDTSGGI